MGIPTLAGFLLLYICVTLAGGYGYERLSAAGKAKNGERLAVIAIGTLIFVPPLGFAVLEVPVLLVGDPSPLLQMAVYTVGVTVTAVLGGTAYKLGSLGGEDSSDYFTELYRPEWRPRALLICTIYASLVAVVSLAWFDFVSLLTVVTAIMLGMGLFRVSDGGIRSADSYRSPTDEETRRIRGCFDAFDSSPGTVAVFSLEDTDAPNAPAVFVTDSFGQRLTYVHEELLDVATDDELAVAFAQATHRSPFANLYTVIGQHLAVLFVVYFLAALNTTALWAFDVGVSELQGPLVPLVFLVTGLFVFIPLLVTLEKWSFAAADDFACRHLGTTTVRRTYRALGDWLVTDPDIDHDDPNASAMSEPPLVRRIERLGGSLIDDTQLVAVTEWFFAGSLAVGIWLGNLFVRPVSLAANSMSATLPTWLVGLASALVGLLLAAMPLLVAYRRRGSLVDSLPSAARSRINTRLELPVVVVCSLLVTDLVLNGHLSFFWLALAALLLFATGLSYRHQYYSYISARSPEHPSAAEADRLRSCLGPEADSVDQILVCEDLWPWEIFVTGDDTHRRLYVERSLLETSDDTLLAVALAEAYERGRELSPHGRFLLSLWALCPLVMGYSVFLFVAGSSVWPAVGVAGALLLPVILFYNRRYAARFHRLDGRLCERFGSETVHEAYVSLEPSVQRQRSSTFTWRTGVAPHPPMKARLTRLPDPDNR